MRTDAATQKDIERLVRREEFPRHGPLTRSETRNPPLHLLTKRGDLCERAVVHGRQRCYTVQPDLEYWPHPRGAHTPGSAQGLIRVMFTF